MSLAKKLHSLRQKPHHVRERYLVIALLAVVPVLVFVWFLTFRHDSREGTPGFFKSVSGSAVDVFNDPVYTDTFGKSALTP